jgi:hypothetical protein
VPNHRATDARTTARGTYERSGDPTLALPRGARLVATRRDAAHDAELDCYDVGMGRSQTF